VKNKLTKINIWSPSITKATKHKKFIKSQSPKNNSHKIAGLLYLSAFTKSFVGKFVLSVVKRIKMFNGISKNKKVGIDVNIGIPILSANGG
jgi:hypothetical protein